MKALWQELERDGSVSIEEIDPKGAASARDFKLFCIDTYGSVLRTWMEHIDPENTDKVKVGGLVDAFVDWNCWEGDGSHISSLKFGPVI